MHYLSKDDRQFSVWTTNIIARWKRKRKHLLQKEWEKRSVVFLGARHRAPWNESAHPEESKALPGVEFNGCTEWSCWSTRRNDPLYYKFQISQGLHGSGVQLRRSCIAENKQSAKLLFFPLFVNAGLKSCIYRSVFTEKVRLYTSRDENTIRGSEIWCAISGNDKVRSWNGSSLYISERE